ncbi:MAG: hypothetical protein M1818_005299 [Claussenomyces sp. TS43310]|nr:MAG: hypothetical protein M1818_005299 [Claussenomyces sp. TS43310]
MSALQSQSSQQRPSSIEHPNASSESYQESDGSAPQSTSPSPSTRSSNVQDVLLNPSKGQSSSEGLADAATQTASEDETRRCWICLQDENDGPDQEWRSPCPCNLQAHSECLLEWIADLEASSSHTPSEKIHCPQCKSEIHVARPRDYLVNAMDFFRLIARKMIFPAGSGAVVGVLYSGSMVYGANVMTLVFGSDDAQRILSQGSTPGLHAMAADRWFYYFREIQRFTDPFLPLPSFNWKVFAGLPSIAPALILSRTSLADHVFAILPVAYFVFHHDSRAFRRWPPNPALVFAIVPYLRMAYRELYKHSFRSLEKEWDQAVQRRPREGETAEQLARARAEDDQANEPGIIDIEVEILNVQEDQEQVEGAPQDNQGLPGAGQAAQAQAGQVPNLQANGRPVGQRPNEPWEFRQNTSLSQLTTTIVGTLFFPAASSLMGNLLRLTLPNRLVTKSVISQPDGLQVLHATGLLQEKWGRTLVGGCLFVLLKDALILYSKWRKAKTHGQRRILDYVKPTPR